MKKITGLLFALMVSAVFMMLAGCSGDEVQNAAVPPTEFSGKTVTIQGTVFDATTGARIDTTGLKLFLVQGTDVRQPNKLVTDVKDLNAADFAFSGIPITSGNNVTYKVVAVKDGYQRFEGLIAPQIDFQNNLIDGVYNQVGNIYLFPKGATAPDYTVQVVLNAKPIKGATVVLNQNANGNAATAATGNRLFAAAGLLPTIIATTDDNGNAVFKGTDLVLGGQYTPTIQPIKVDGIQLAQGVGGAFFVGAGAQNVLEVVEMNGSVIEPNNNAYGLYAVKVSNQAADYVSSTGTLEITFNRPVDLYNTTTGGFNVTLNGIGGTAVKQADSAAGVSPVTNDVTAALSADGLVLTLTYNLATGSALDAAKDKGASATYAETAAAWLTPKGVPGALFSLNGAVGTQIRDAAGNAIDLNVQLLTD